MNSRALLKFIFFCFFSIPLYSQADSTLFRVKINGYVKFLHSGFILQDQALLTDQLIHNRLNIKQLVNRRHSWVLELRNRIFYGQSVQSVQQLGGNYIDFINPDRQRWLQPSVGMESKKGIAWLLAVDRAYWQWTPKDWEIRLGRQRINWGMSTVWNPNDIFNAYGFADFDYEERPAVDALRVNKFIGYSGSVEAVVSFGSSIEDINIGARYKTFINTYDIQILLGYSEGYFAVGAGTAGNLGMMGLKAESTLFIPDNSNGTLSYSATAVIDYTLSEGLYISTGMLYNHLGGSDNSLADLFAFDLSARNLYPYKWAILGSASYPITELMTGGLSMIYSPVKAQALFIMPTLSYSISQSWDLDFIGQLAFNKQNGGYRSPISGLFLRVKVSF